MIFDSLGEERGGECSLTVQGGAQAGSVRVQQGHTVQCALGEGHTNSAKAQTQDFVHARLPLCPLGAIYLALRPGF